MNKMIVSPWLSVSPSGPITHAHPQGDDLIHLRQGEMDGACGPYCVVMTLVTLGVMTHQQAKNISQADGRSRLGRFRDTLSIFGPLVSGGTDDVDVGWLIDCFKAAGVVAEAFEVAPRRKKTIENIAAAIDDLKIPMVSVNWDGESGHWLLVIGYQGYQEDEDGDIQITHLLCLDPASEAPRVSLWNAVIEVFDPQGGAINEGRYYCRHWGSSDKPMNCRIDTSVVVGLDKKNQARYFE